MLSRRVMRLIFKVLLNSIIIGVFSILFVNLTVPRAEDVFRMKFSPYIIFKDSQNNLLATYGSIKYPDTKFEDIPTPIINSLIVLEDKRFWHHCGIDFLGIIRAAYKNFTSNKIVEGGSSITQQLAKNIIFNIEGFDKRKSYLRKVREAILAIKLEFTFTKKEIISLYLSRVYFGSNTYGIKAAAWKFFGKQNLNDLTIFESAYLISLLKAPSRYSFNNESVKDRINFVLSKMLEYNYISIEEYELAILNKPMLLHNNLNNDSMFYFTDWVLHSQIPSWISDMNYNLEIITTIDSQLQEAAFKSTQEVFKQTSHKWKMGNLALLATDYNGNVKCMIGGVKYHNGGFNRATQALRQTGSLFKFFVYLEAIRNNIDENTLIEDSSPNINGWSPSNYYHIEQGILPMQIGLIKSINGITVRLAQQVGINKIIELAHLLGLEQNIPNDLSISLGSANARLIEMVRAFSVVPNQGELSNINGIIKVKNSDTGQILVDYSEHQHEKKSAIQILEANRIGTILRKVVLEGTARSLKTLPYPVAGKTGSSQKYSDFWFVGFTPKLIIGTWCGNDDYNQKMMLNKGPNPSLLIWKKFAEAIQHSQIEIDNFNQNFIV
ncbi:MAG: transglycosylase domain-containing protein [Alphaproteobacteria bacterium]|nr:MAG: transglycosylase domain-containing protein [Alphaproteobacteria bacterium]